MNWLRRKLLFICLSASASCCVAQDCEVDTSKYLDAMRTIEKYHLGDSVMRTNHFLESIAFLGQTTKITAQYARKYIPEYEEDSLYQQDMTNWENWLNQCLNGK